MSERLHDDLLALVDELPSLFADADEAQVLATPSDGRASHSGASPSLTNQDSKRDVCRQLASPAPPALSADEIAELLYDIDSPSDLDEPPYQQQLQQRALAPKQQQPARQLSRKKSKGAPHKSNKARDGRKAEILLLRKTVFELESRLDGLKKQTNDDPDDGNGSRELSNYSNGGYSRWGATQFQLTQNDDPDAELQSAWREIARRQWSQRDASERENSRLRLVLESQLKVARSLEKFLLLKAASTMELSRNVDLRGRHYYRIPRDSSLSNDPSEAEIFQELFAGVEQSLAEVDAIYEANGLARMEKTQMSARMRLDPATGMLVEVCAAKVLPFGVRETGEAVWGHCMFDKQSLPSRCYSYHAHKGTTGVTEDTIVEDFSLELHAKNTHASFRVRQVMRRVVEDERIVVVWRSFFDPTEFSEQQLSRVRFLEKGYIVIRKSSASSSSLQRPSVTLLQPCYIIYPHSTTTDGGNLTDESDSVIDAIAEFMLSSTVTNIADSHQMVENMLLEQALRQQSRLDAPFAIQDATGAGF